MLKNDDQESLMDVRWMAARSACWKKGTYFSWKSIIVRFKWKKET